MRVGKREIPSSKFLDSDSVIIVGLPARYVFAPRVYEERKEKAKEKSGKIQQ